jgi:hypothetical protein
MASRTIGIFRWSGKEGAGARRAKHDAIVAYAASKAVWGKPEIVIAETGERLLEEGGALGPILKTVSAGDHLILSGFADLSDSPSELLVGTAQLQSTGADIHILELGGGLDASMAALRMAWANGSKVEEALTVERQHAKEREAFWIETFNDYQRQSGRAMAARMGAEAFPELALPEAVVEAIPQPVANGHDPEPDHAVIGAYLKQQREVQGFTQGAIGARLGVDASQISRLEATGKGSLLVRAFEVLDPEALPSAELQMQIGAAPAWYLAAYVKPRLTSKPKEEINVH